MVHSLSWKLSGALLLVVVVSLGLMVYLTNATTTREFNQYFMGGMMGGMLNATQQEFLNRINSSLWTAALMAAGAALLLGFVLTRQITKPVFALTAGASKIAGGELSHRVSIDSRDELGTLAQSFNEMAGSLEKAEQSRKRLIADIAHELRTPLTIIEGTINGIIDGVFTPDQEHLGSIKEQTTLLTRLIGDLRDLSLADSGQLKLELAPTDVVALARRKLTQIEPAARQKKIELKLQSHGGLPDVNVDSARMEQVLANLLTNAIRHTSEGGKITVAISKLDKDGTHHPSLLISVADTGEGIAPEHLPYVFERFYRVESSRSRGEGGVGLGLAIVKQMVEAHGGKVWAESEAGKGATFYITLPLSQS
ncbi:MAG: HAMP domain-containing protein [Chloroflexi bacterium]|nr:HAMP domain-containing protein [Chloroflexota bacterium]